MAKILIIDDDKDFVDATKTLVEAKGYTAVTANCGADGFALAKKEKPDVILLDVMMTYDSEGFDIARNLKKDDDTRGIPIIIITGVRKAKHLPFGFEPDEDWLPVKEVLEKPVKPEMLIECVKKVIAR
jgi:CheY-like chemotaxis protein